MVQHDFQTFYPKLILSFYNRGPVYSKRRFNE